MTHFSFKEVLRIVLYGVGLSSIAALIFLAGPLISIGGYHPLETMIGREIAILRATTSRPAPDYAHEQFSPN